jgi:molecular chaperone GrpE
MTEQDAADDSGGDPGASDADGDDSVGRDDGARGTEVGSGDAGPDADGDGEPEGLEEIVDENGGDWERLDDIAGGVEPDDGLVERVEDRDSEDVAAELAGLRDAVSDLEGQLEEREAEIEDLESRLARKQADFQNYKKRQEQKMEDVRARATEDLVTRLLDVRDNLARALEQDEDADIRGGVESTLQQFDEELDREEVAVIEPEPGEETDPTRHEVLMRVESDQPEGTIEDVHRPGYEMGGKVLRAAQVTVSDG